MLFAVGDKAVNPPDMEVGNRRLIIIVVQPGTDPEIDYEPADSFSLWEVRAVFNRCLEILEEEEVASIKRDDEEEDE